MPGAGTSYAEGAAALSPRVQQKDTKAAPKKAEDPAVAAAAAKEKERQEASQKSYEDLLGSWLGGKLYELVAKELSADKLLKYGDQGLDAAVKAGAGLIDPVEGFSGMDEKSEADAVKKFATALAGWGAEKAEEWLKSDDGKAFRTKISQWFEGHPGAVVAIALLAAAGAVAANVSLPELKKKFNLGKGFSAEAGVELNKIRDIVLKGASVGLSYKHKDVSAGLTYKYAKGEGEKADAHTIGAQVKKGAASLNGTATVQGDRFVLDTKGAYTADGYSLAAGLKHTHATEGNTTVGTVTAKVGDKDHNVSGNAAYDFSAGTLSFGLSQFHNMGDYDLRSGYTSDPKKGTTTTLGTDIRLQKDFKLSLDYAMAEQGADTLAASATKTWGADKEWSAALSGKFNLTDGELETVSTRFGFRDKDEFSTFMVGYARTYKDRVPSDKFSLMMETSIKGLMLRGTNTTSLTGGRLTENVTQVHAAHAVTKDLTLFGGGKFGVQQQGAPGLNDNNRGAWIEAGVQFKKVPFVVSFRPEDQAVSFGLVIPFGR